MQNMKPLSVKEIARYLSGKINNDQNLKQVAIEGEISNFTLHQSGHIYFSLKEDDTSIRAVLFRGYRQNLDFLPSNGMKVIIVGDVNIYEKTSNLQIYVQRMFQSGIGDIYLQFEQLKDKLSSEGLFDPSHKKPIPRYPSSIGVITSPTGAALQDLRNVVSRRYPLCTVRIYPTLVQGEHAADSIIESLLSADKGGHDTLLLIRGGGSVEDLYVFNNERIARTIYSLSTPIITGIGHEIDFTIADFVSDLRAPTPSAAAELSVPAIRDILSGLADTEDRMHSRMTDIFEQRKQLLDRYRKDFAQALSLTFTKGLTDVNEMRFRLNRYIDIIMSEHRHLISTFAARLSSDNPLDILKRGFAKITDDENRNITSVKQVNTGDLIKIDIADGTMKAEIKEKKHGKTDI